MGRLFDAVASLLGICDLQTYEGEAAMLLENIALKYFKKHRLDFETFYSFAEPEQLLSTQKLASKIIKDIVAEKTLSYISAKFHFSLVKMIVSVAEKNPIQKIVFSGGVFQNGVLVDLILHHLGKEYELFFHERLSPNDENVSFGQVVYYKILNHSNLGNRKENFWPQKISILMLSLDRNRFFVDGYSKNHLKSTCFCLKAPFENKMKNLFFILFSKNSIKRVDELVKKGLKKCDRI